MKRVLWFGLALTVFAAAASARAQNTAAQQSITLYAPKYAGDLYRVSVDLQDAAYAPRLRFGDVGYGLLRVGPEVDWLEISVAQDRRSAFLDLGPHAWTDSFKVPWVEPLARLKPGEERQIFVDSSGQNGQDGRDGFGAGNGRGLSALPSTGPDQGYPTETPRRAKREAGVRTSPNMLRAILGHIYVLHVVDDRRDFYALVRIESMQRGDNCTISWKMIPAPPPPAVSK
ncbi:MAG TPA: hypothetical protein VE961_23800 [Pyrinomonadaceae bacterium]|nr:hypothetical protein [Pyrinomonadaceae bacterium]